MVSGSERLVPAGAAVARMGCCTSAAAVVALGAVVDADVVAVAVDAEPVAGSGDVMMMVVVVVAVVAARLSVAVNIHDADTALPLCCRAIPSL